MQYDILEDSESKACVRIERYNNEKKYDLMAATYMLVTLEDDANCRDVIDNFMRSLSDPKPLLWVEKCRDFEQMVAIHFEPRDFGIFDQLLSLSDGLFLKSTPDYLNTGNDAIDSPQPDGMVESTVTSYNQIATSLLTIIDTPIIKTHEYLRDCVIKQDDCHQNNDDYEHGTFVAGVVKQINSNIPIFFFPVVKVVMFPDRSTYSYSAVELFYSPKGVQLSGIGMIAAALAAFSNSASRVANLSMGVANTKKEVIDFITPLMKKLRLQESILVVAAGNKGLDNDSVVNDLFVHFTNLQFVENNRSFIMDNIIEVAAVDNMGQLARFSNFGKTKVMLAAPGKGVNSCSSLPNQFKTKSGTSFSAPQVAATLAMMFVHFPFDSYSQIIDRLRLSVDLLPSLESTTISGGRLNINRALGGKFVL